MEAHNNPCNRVFNTLELREHIMGFADSASLARCARVCSLWSSPALDVLWEEVEDVASLVAVICPLSKSAGIYYFARATTRHDWKRFQGYARRVKRLSIATDTISDDIVYEVCLKRPTLCLAPKLKRLCLSCNDQPTSDLSLLFMHEKLEELSVYLPRDRDYISDYFQEIAVRTPGVHKLVLNVHSSFSPVLFEDSLVELIAHLRKLVSICLPLNNLTSSIANALTESSSLKEIKWEDNDLGWTGVSFDRFTPVLPVGAFPSLRKLEMAPHFADMGFLKGPHTFTANLTCLSLQSVTLETVDALRSLLEIISQSCCSLEVLHVDSIPLDWNRDAPNHADEGPFTVTSPTLQSLSSLKKMEKLVLRHPFPFKLSNDDLLQFLSTLPQLINLEFNCCPLMLEEPPKTPSLTVEVLHKIARLCPKLRDLRLYLNCATVPNLPVIFPDHDSSAFLNMKILDFHVSRVGNNVAALARYLSHVCPSSCVFPSSTYWKSNIRKQFEDKYGADIWEETWLNNCEKIKILMDARRDERDQTRNHINYLEDRVRELEEALKSAAAPKRKRATRKR